MTQEALKLALEVNESMKDVLKQVNELIAENKALKEALAQTQEPVARLFGSLPVYDTTPPQRTEQELVCVCGAVWDGQELMEAPPQRTWVNLTRTQMQDVYFEVLKEHRGGHQMEGQLAFGEALQAKLKEKNT